MSSDLYGKHATRYAESIQNNIYNAHYERPSLQALLGDLRGEHVLDIGCGSGIYAEFMRTEGAASITCVDASQAMVDLTKQAHGDHVKAYVQDVSRGLPQEGSSTFDVIVAPLVIHYLEDLTPLFQDIHRVLKPGGYVVFSTHHPYVDIHNSTSGNYYDREVVKEMWNTIGEPVEVTFYRRPLGEIMDAVTDNGMVITRISEGRVDDIVQSISPTYHQRLSTQPAFLFLRGEKPKA